MHLRSANRKKLILPVSLLLTVALVVVVDFFQVPNPNVILLTGIVFFSFLGGYTAGSVSAIVVVLYSIYFFSIPGHILQFTPENFKRIIVIALFIPIMVFLVGTLKKRYDQKTKELEHANAELNALSRLDHLTGIPNRRCFDDAFQQEFRRAMRDKKGLSLLMVDIDYFKEYNDEYGHVAGDICLQKVSKILSQALHRPADVVARFGGEEFVVLLPDTDAPGAFHIAQTILTAVNSSNIPHIVSPVCPLLTVSIGVETMIPTVGSAPIQLLENADQALYLAKSKGRNQAASLPQ